jgi:hypothetical protein
MKRTAAELENKLDELLAHLECDVEYLQNCLLYLDELKKLVIKRDEAALLGLLEVIQTELVGHKKHEQNRQLARRELAEALGCSSTQITLTALQKFFPQDKCTRLVDIKAKLKTLVERLKVEYAGTAILVAECSRFNSLVLKSIFAQGKTGETYYNANGAANRQSESAFVNLRL